MMSDFDTKYMPAARDAIAPDGSEVRVLLGLRAGGMACFELAAGQTSQAVAHRTVEEIWYILGDRRDHAALAGGARGLCCGGEMAAYNACRASAVSPFRSAIVGI